MLLSLSDPNCFSLPLLLHCTTFTNTKSTTCITHCEPRPQSICFPVKCLAFRWESSYVRYRSTQNPTNSKVRSHERMMPHVRAAPLIFFLFNRYFEYILELAAMLSLKYSNQEAKFICRYCIIELLTSVNETKICKLFIFTTTACFYGFDQMLIRRNNINRSIRNTNSLIAFAPTLTAD